MNNKHARQSIWWRAIFVAPMQPRWLAVVVARSIGIVHVLILHTEHASYDCIDMSDTKIARHLDCLRATKIARHQLLARNKTCAPPGLI